MKIKGIELLTYDIPNKLNSIIPKKIRKKIIEGHYFIYFDICFFSIYEDVLFLILTSNSMKHFSGY